MGIVVVRQMASDGIDMVTNIGTGTGQDNILNVQGGVHAVSRMDGLR